MKNVHYTYRIMTVQYEDTEDVFRFQTLITGKFTVEQSPNCSVRHYYVNPLSTSGSPCQFTSKIVWSMGVPGGGVVGASPPSLLGKQSQSGNIRSTVGGGGEYWLIIKKNGKNSVNFVGNCVIYVGNFVISWKICMF